MLRDYRARADDPMGIRGFVQRRHHGICSSWRIYHYVSELPHQRQLLAVRCTTLTRAVRIAGCDNRAGTVRIKSDASDWNQSESKNRTHPHRLGYRIFYLQQQPGPNCTYDRKRSRIHRRVGASCLRRLDCGGNCGRVCGLLDWKGVPGTQKRLPRYRHTWFCGNYQTHTEKRRLADARYLDSLSSALAGTHSE